MRADRLIAVLLLLQRHETVTASQVAEELEVSERTARRDLEALAMSGVPVYSRHGRGGGWSLIGGASTDLTGLVADEAQALFLALSPALDNNPELRSALNKLTGALPETFRAQARNAASAIRIDPTAWGQEAIVEPPAFLEQLTDAVVEGRQVEMDYDSARRSKGTRIVHPLGLIAKRNTWYLVANMIEGETRSFRADRVLSLRLLDDPVDRPVDFDLDREWARIRSTVEAMRVGTEIRVHIDPQMMGPLRWLFGSEHVTEHEIVQAGETVGMVDVTVMAHNPNVFAVQIAGFGKRIRLIDAPEETFTRLAELAAELVELYG